LVQELLSPLDAHVNCAKAGELDHSAHIVRTVRSRRTKHRPTACELVRSPAIKTISRPEYELGSGLIDYSQKMTTAAIQMADMKVCAHRS
jgi:hypothetical protein